MIDGSGFIHLAGKLCVLSGADEAAFRAAASRAYYGAFHLAMDFFSDLEISVPRSENAHGFLRLHLMGSGHSQAVIAGGFLRELHRLRVNADYDLKSNRFRTAETAKFSVEQAHKFRALLDECRQEPARSEVRAGIKDYQQKLGD